MTRTAVFWRHHSWRSRSFRKRSSTGKPWNCRFTSVTWPRQQFIGGLNRIEAVARAEAGRYGLAALDALHVAAAFLLRGDELITTEKPGKPMYRTSLIKVRSLYR